MLFSSHQTELAPTPETRIMSANTLMPSPASVYYAPPSTLGRPVQSLLCFGPHAVDSLVLEADQDRLIQEREKKFQAWEAEREHWSPLTQGRHSTFHGYDHSSPSQHRDGATVSEQYTQSRLICIRDGEITQGRIEAICSPSTLSNCLPQTGTRRIGSTTKTPKKFVTDEKRSFVPELLLVGSSLSFSLPSDRMVPC